MSAAVFAASEFKVFAGALASGGVVKGIVARDGAGDWPRSRMDALNQTAIDAGAKGLAWVAFTSAGEVRSPVAKFFTDDEMAALRERLRRRARRPRAAWWPTRATSPTRCSATCGCGSPTSSVCARRASTPCGSSTSRCSSGTPTRSAGTPTTTRSRGRSTRTSTSSRSDPAAVLSYSYDLVMNGNEIGGGTLRIHSEELQRRVLGVLGIAAEEARREVRLPARGARRWARRLTAASRSASTGS